MPATLRHFAINADDVPRAKRFYEEAFGWTFTPWGPPGFYQTRTTGDVQFDAVRDAIGEQGWISPVPGGVGPMTVTMLIENTLRSAERFANGEAFHPPQPFWQVPAR